MNTFVRKRTIVWMLALAVAAGLVSAQEDPVIVSMRDGVVTFTNLTPGMEYKVEWATTLTDTNGFRSSFSGMDEITPTNTAAMTWRSRSFFRIADRRDCPTTFTAPADTNWSSTPLPTPSIPWNGRNMPMGPGIPRGSRFSKPPAGNVMRIPTPNYYRVTSKREDCPPSDRSRIRRENHFLPFPSLSGNA
jgi:hypothetical protein